MYFFYSQTKIGHVNWIRADKARLQVGNHKFTVPTKVLKSGPSPSSVRLLDAEVDVTFDAQGIVSRVVVRKTTHVCKNWKLYSYSGDPEATKAKGSQQWKVSLVCSNCDARKERLATKRETKTILGGDSLFGSPKKPTTVHTVWHNFADRFCKDSKNETENFRYSGYDLSDKVAEWAKKYPDDVKIVGVDDSYHANSDLVLIEHQTKDEYMGTSVVYIPQCTGEPPTRFFLYSEDRQRLIQALQEISKASKIVQAKDKIRRAKRSLAISKLFREG